MSDELADLRKAAQMFFFGAATRDGVSTPDIVSAVEAVLLAANQVHFMVVVELPGTSRNFPEAKESSPHTPLKENLFSGVNQTKVHPGRAGNFERQDDDE